MNFALCPGPVQFHSWSSCDMSLTPYPFLLLLRLIPVLRDTWEKFCVSRYKHLSVMGSDRASGADSVMNMYCTALTLAPLVHDRQCTCFVAGFSWLYCPAKDIVADQRLSDGIRWWVTVKNEPTCPISPHIRAAYIRTNFSIPFYFPLATYHKPTADSGDTSQAPLAGVQYHKAELYYWQALITCRRPYTDQM